MDPLSIAAGTRSIGDSIQETYDNVHHLQSALIAIKEMFEKRPRQEPFERKHHSHIHQIVQSCHGLLKTLKSELPRLGGNNRGVTEKVRLSLMQCLKEPRIQQIVQRIASYTTILQLSLTTLSLGTLWGTQRTQDQIQSEIRKLTDEMRSAKLFSDRAVNKDNSLSHVPSHKSELDEDTEESPFHKEIRDWRQSADNVATMVSLKDFDGASFDGSSIPPDASVSGDTLRLYEEDIFDPEPGLLDVQSHDVLEYQIEENQNIVRQLVSCGIFPRASPFQKHAIELIEQLSIAEDAELVPDKYRRLTDSREKLADILLECDSAERDLEAKEVLQILLQEECRREADQIDHDRRARLYHKLGNLCAKLGNIRQARKFLKRAFEGRKRMNPTPYALVEESAELLIKILQLDEAYDEAQGLREWMRRELRPSLDTQSQSSATGELTVISSPAYSPTHTNAADNICDITEVVTAIGLGIDTGTVSTNLTDAYQWCKGQGLDVDNPNFHFDICDLGSGITPMHRAIQAEELAVLSHMVSHVRHVEQRDESFSTPLHTAASMRNRKIVSFLLHGHGADANVEDRQLRTPLHRCQASSGGVGVAELLLKAGSDLIDRRDNFGKTALYMACEKGNEKMVRFLLTTGGANPNIQGPGNCTPLVTAIDMAAQSRNIAIVQELLCHDADPYIADADGRNAFTAASNAGLAGIAIKRMLNKVPRRRDSDLSTTTKSSTRSNISNDFIETR
ncbi:ankyrin [Whalleya microplaca]|nr:ankyrin [Whalleya microplaca]